MTARSICDVPGVSMSVALLLPVFTSLAPAPGVTVAVLAISPLVLGLIVPRTVSVSALPAPGGRLALVNDTFPPSVPVRATGSGHR